jgi:hypothetical protein
MLLFLFSPRCEEAKSWRFLLRCFGFLWDLQFESIGCEFTWRLGYFCSFYSYHQRLRRLSNISHTINTSQTLEKFLRFRFERGWFVCWVVFGFLLCTYSHYRYNINFNAWRYIQVQQIIYGRVTWSWFWSWHTWKLNTFDLIRGPRQLQIHLSLLLRIWEQLLCHSETS